MREISKHLRKGKVIAYCDNNNLLISFEGCFEYESNLTLPKHFVKRDDRIFVKSPSYKLQKFTNTLYKLKTDGKVYLKDLKSFLPTVFNPQIIKRENSINYFETYKSYITDMSIEVLGDEETKKILKEKSDKG